jgi:hypothetical protein
MTELVVRLRRKELDYLKRNREHVFAPPSDGSYIGQIVRSRFLWALEKLESEPQSIPHEEVVERASDIALRRHELLERLTDPYADEPDEDA